MKAARSLLASLMMFAAAPALAAPPDPLEFFEKRVRPVLAEHCFECHGPKKQKGGLRLDTEAFFRRGGESGKLLTPGNIDTSLLLRAIRHEGDTKMPPKKLSDDAIAALAAWARAGAPWPKNETVRDDADAWKKHWAFQPVRMPTPPAVKDRAWPTSPMDHFVLAKLEARGWTPAPQADRRTLLRRVHFDLTGLPPTPEEVETFVRDPAHDAYEKAIDRLLASPQFGERWARHWLDLARYADERGYVGVNVDRVYPYAYAYRDWVVRAFNEDLPYDRFALLQLAADKVVTGADNRDLAAMGFLTVGRRFLNNPHDIIDDRIDVVCRGLMGLTVGCARCHDHKYDPVPIRDYYSLYGVFASSTEPADLPLLAPAPASPERAAFDAELRKLEDVRAKWIRDNDEMKRNRLREFQEKSKPFDNKIKKLKATHPGAPPHAMVMLDKPRPVNPRVFLRGSPTNPGPVVPRQFLALLAGPARKPFARNGSGRLELAQAIVRADNPLTARVRVNRIWQQLFGAGLVRTSSDFGLRSEPPSHPGLLDHLAARFVAEGWSTKKLIRAILLSRTYQQSSIADCGSRIADSKNNPQLVDPDNALLWKMSRRRLDFEAMRDSLLAVAGRLEPALGGRSLPLTKPPFSRRRTLYGFIDRQNLPGIYRTFDFASPDTHSPRRFTTTVPQQALFLMNSPFLIEQATHLAMRPGVANGSDDARVKQLYRLVLNRPPTAAESARALRFIHDATADKPRSLGAWEQYAQVLLLSNEFAFVD